jgi:hypothetical protein
MNTPTGFLYNDWRKLLGEVKYSVDRPYLGRAAQVWYLSLMNSRFHKQEMAEYSTAIDQAQVREPIFILGHWRSGTTLLHELLAMDSQFGYPNLFEISRPQTFLVREPVIEKQAASAPPIKRPMDNMQVTYRSPGEDEPALAMMSLRSPTISWMFPRYEDRYDRYLTFRDAPVDDIERWKTSLNCFLRKLTVKYGRPLLIKSPAHTARLGLLAEMFPDARFIHIARNPFSVYQSSLKLYDTAVKGSYLHNPVDGSVQPGILRRYKDMYDAYFEQRKFIPTDRLYEIKFEDFEKDKLDGLKKVYEYLRLSGFAQAEPIYQKYLAGIDGYKKNVHKPIDGPWRSQIIREWARSFDEWGYPTNDGIQS